MPSLPFPRASRNSLSPSAPAPLSGGRSQSVMFRPPRTARAERESVQFSSSCFAAPYAPTQADQATQKPTLFGSFPDDGWASSFSLQRTPGWLQVPRVRGYTSTHCFKRYGSVHATGGAMPEFPLFNRLVDIETFLLRFRTTRDSLLRSQDLDDMLHPSLLPVAVIADYEAGLDRGVWRRCLHYHGN